MDKQEYKQIRKKVSEEAKHIFESEPEVNKWVMTKKWIFGAIAIFVIVHSILTTVVRIHMQVDVNPVIDVLRPFFNVFWIYVFVSPKGSWRINAVFYFFAMTNFVFNTLSYMRNFRGMFLQIFTEYPPEGIMIVMEMMIPFIFLFTACYLTIPKSHRNLSERADQIQKQFINRNKELYKKSV